MDDKKVFLLLDKATGAMLGAACGDALGWPNEQRSRLILKKEYQVSGSLKDFRKWARRSGGRFYPHEEVIEAGEYSDDTQLILCLSRSLLCGDEWWQNLTHVELPFWLLYERGGGGATKRAASVWSTGKSPWGDSRNQKDVKSYFDAGGNGVAMRILPHILYNCNIEKFDLIAKNIFLDGISTHGHPKALVGALAYGYALWKSLRRTDRLEYGVVVEDLLCNIHEWSTLPDITDLNKDWLSTANKYLADYQNIWDDTVKEFESSLSICKNELQKDALVIDDNVLEAIKCFDKRVNGSGTVAAAAAVFIASRYASDPVNGVVKAAHTIDTDTDTIASMAGGLLGAICGSEWVSYWKNSVQDSAYIINLANKLISKNRNISFVSTEQLYKKVNLDQWIDYLSDKAEGETIDLPDGRKGTISPKTGQLGRSGKYMVLFRKVLTDDGQNLYFSKISKLKGKSEPAINSNEIEKNDQPKPRPQALTFGVKIPVASFEKSIPFYVEFLGLKIRKQSPYYVVFEEGLVLVPKDYAKQIGGTQFQSLLYIEVYDIDKFYDQLKRHNIRVRTPLGPWGKSNRKFFRCIDPDGNVIEIFSSDISATTNEAH